MVSNRYNFYYANRSGRMVDSLTCPWGRFLRDRAQYPEVSVFAFMKFLEYVIIFGMGAMTYYFIELLWRGYSHWTMAVVGGIALVLIGLLNEGILPEKFGIIPQAIVGSVIITMMELIAGIILNIWLGLGIWDYSHMWGNFLGQICPLFSFLWTLLSIVAIYVDDLMRHWFFGETAPNYVLWMRK